MAATRRAIRIFSAVEALREGQADVRSALLPIFQPELGKHHGKLFDPKILAEEINTAYRLGITAEVIEDFIPLFKDRGWISESSSGTHMAYTVLCENDLEIESARQEFEQACKSIALDFRSFIELISPLSQFELSPENLIDILVEWLVTLDAFNDDHIKAAVSKPSRVGKKLIFNVESPDAGAASEQQYLAARYVNHLFRTKSPYVSLLTELASVGLITEVVRDFQHPQSKVTSTNLFVYLDAPVALDYLGCSGSAAQQNVRNILDRVVAAGGGLRIFRTSVEEMKRLLRALLMRGPGEREGITHRALQRGEVLEPFVRRVATSPDGILAEAGIAIIEHTLQQFPNEHRYLPDSDVQDLYGRVGWVTGDDARWHDASIAALVVRKRAGHQTNDLFAARHVVITKNPMFGPTCRRFLIENGKLSRGQIGPVVHQRSFATDVWLRTGAGKGDQEIPRSYILSACQRVLTVKKNVVDQARHEASKLEHPEVQDQLELLLNESRATQVLMDKTLGSASVITGDNLPQLLDEMKRSLVRDVEERHEAALKQAKEQAASDIRAREDQIGLAQAANIEKESQLAELKSALRTMQTSVVVRANKRIARRRSTGLLTIAIFMLAVDVAAFLVNTSAGLAGAIFVVLAFATLVIDRFGALGVHKWVDGLFEKWAWSVLDEERLASSVHAANFEDHVKYAEGKFHLIGSITQSENGPIVPSHSPNGELRF